MADLVREYLAVTGRRRLLLPVRLPGRAARAVRAGVILVPEHADGRQTWTEFLAERLSETTSRPAA
jgi:hypothetical protein